MMNTERLIRNIRDAGAHASRERLKETKKESEAKRSVKISAMVFDQYSPGLERWVTKIERMEYLNSQDTYLVVFQTQAAYDRYLSDYPIRMLNDLD